MDEKKENILTEVEQAVANINKDIALQTSQLAPKMDMDPLNDEELKQIEDYAASIDIHNTSTVISYGAAAQRKVAEFSESALGNVTSKDLGAVGEALTSVITELKGFEIDKEEDKGFFSFFRRSAKKGANKVMALKTSYERAEANIEKVKNEFMANSSDLLSSEKSKLDQELQKLDAAITAAEVTFDTSTLSVDAQNALKTLDECSKLICDFEREVDELEKLKPFSPDHLLQDADKATKEKLSNLYSTLGKVQFPKIREIRAVMAQIYDLQEEIKNNGEGKDGDLPDVKTFQDNLSKELAEKMYFLKRDYVGPLKAYKEAIYDGDNPPIDRA